MATIDVSAAPVAPAFASEFTVMRKTQTVGSTGRAQETAVAGFPTTATGTVCPSKSRLKREADGQKITADLEIITPFRLSEGEGALLADVVTWGGVEYTVMSTDDYSQFGGGFVHAFLAKKTIF